MTLNRFTSRFLVALAMSLLPASVLAHAETQPLLAQTDSLSAQANAEQSLTGTVHVLVVDNPLRGASIRQIELQLDDGTLVPLRGDGSAALAQGARATVSGRQNGKGLDVSSAQTLAGAANATKSNAEVDGSLAILHADDFAHGKSSFVYELHQPSGKVSRLRLGTLPGNLAPGMRLRVSGRAEADGESITPDHITVLAEPTSATEANAAVAKAATSDSVLVILANFNDTAPPALSAAQAQQVMTSNADSVANFFREASYGQQLMNVAVTPAWVTMNLARPANCNVSDWQNIGIAAEAASKTLGAAYDPAAYQFVVYLFPTVSACGWVGLAYISNPRKAWINGGESFYTSAISHEMGHNFGLLHAGSLDCGSTVIGGNCVAREYGDPFDTMGNQSGMHYSAMQKSKLGWIASSAVQTYAGGSATYTLTPLEVPGGATYAVKIRTASPNRTYWLEFRQPIGFDRPLAAFPSNGAQIRVSSPFETNCPGCDTMSDDTQLLDATPTTPSFNDATLVAGNTFSDPTYGINITVVSANASGMTLQVSSGSSPTSPARAPTITTVKASANPAFAGSSVTFSASVRGGAPAGTVQFTADGATIAGCDAVALSRLTASARCATSLLAAGTHAIVAAYSGNSTNAPSTSATLTEVVNVAPAGSTCRTTSTGMRRSTITSSSFGCTTASGSASR